MKKLLLLTLILCLVVPCFGCNQGDLPPVGSDTTDGTTDETTTEMITEETTGDQQPEIEWIETIPESLKLKSVQPVGTYSDMISRFKNVPLNELSVVDYIFPDDGRFWGHSDPNYNFFALLGSRKRQSYVTASGPIDDINQWDKYFPIQHIVQLDENHICVVHRLVWDYPCQDSKNHPFQVTINENDPFQGTEYYAYVLFSRVFEEYDGVVYERWTRMNTDSGTLSEAAPNQYSQATEVYFASRALEYKDFCSIRVGDSLAKVAEIEPAVHFDRASHSYTRPAQESRLLLKDGILIICADYDEEAYKCAENPATAQKVTDIKFYPFGTYAAVDCLKLSILEADNLPPLPPE